MFKKKSVEINTADRDFANNDDFKEYLKRVEQQPKVLLINPLNVSEKNKSFSHIGKHRPRQPLGLAYVSSFLKKFTSVQLVDAAVLKWGTQKTIDYIKAVNPEILIISSSPMDRWQNADLDISEVLNIIDQSRIKNTVLIGTHGSVTTDWVFEKSRVKFIVRSEPEMTCSELVEKIISNKADFESIAGLSFRHNNEIIHNPDRIFDTNLDDYPLPDYESLPMHLYGYSTPDLPRPFSLMLTSRGCPSQCIFCLKKMMPDRFRARSSQKVFEEIKYLVKNFGIRSIYFQDWEFMVDRQRVREFCQMLIDADFKIIWGCSARANALDAEMVALMKRAGCSLINFGYESGSPEILKLNKKGVTIEKVKEAVEACHKEGINIRSFCLVNLPGENKKTLKESANFIVSHNLNVPHINIPIPYPGTQLAEQVGCNSWDQALLYTGRVNTNLEPERARRLLRNYIWQGRYGKFYLANPKFMNHVFKILKRRFFH